MIRAFESDFTPTYRLGCKRVLISNDFYPAFNRDNVSLVTDSIQSIEPAGVRTQRREVARARRARRRDRFLRHRQSHGEEDPRNRKRGSRGRVSRSASQLQGHRRSRAFPTSLCSAARTRRSGTRPSSSCTKVNSDTRRKPFARRYAPMHWLSPAGMRQSAGRHSCEPSCQRPCGVLDVRVGT